MGKLLAVLLVLWLIHEEGLGVAFMMIAVLLLWLISKLDLFGFRRRGTFSGGRHRSFKTRCDLTRRQPISQFEDKMARGMLREGKEVWVTAFCVNGGALTATATVGDWGKCEPSDDVARWPEKCQRLGAEEVRWYHNHPRGFGKSLPSRDDRRTHRELKGLLEPWGIRFRSFLVYPSVFSYRIKEFGP